MMKTFGYIAFLTWIYFFGVLGFYLRGEQLFPEPVWVFTTAFFATTTWVQSIHVSQLHKMLRINVTGE